MSVSGVCQVCEAAEARHSCDQCGALVCDSHYDREYGFCVSCATRLRRERERDDPDGDSRLS